MGLGHDGLSGDALDDVSYLQAQINRYTLDSKGAAGFALWPVGVPIDGVLSLETAQRVLQVLQLRGLRDGDMDLFTRVTRDGFKDPIAWVKANLQTSSDIVKNFGDKNGLAPASITRGGDIPSWMFIAAAATGVYFLLGRRKRR